MSVKNKTSLGKNIIYQLFYQIVVLLSPLIVTPYLSRVLGPVELGKYAYAYSIAYYFVLLGTLGITSHGSRQIASARDNEKKLNDVYSNLFWLHIFSAVIVCCIYFIFIAAGHSPNKTLSLIMGLYVISTVFDVKWLFYGLETFKITVIRNLFIKLIFIISVFLFVNNRSDVHIYTFIMSFVSFFLAELSLFLITPKYVKLKRPELNRIKKEIIPLFVMFIPTAASLICRHTDRVMVGMLSTLEQVGLSENTDKVYMLLVTLITTVGDVMLPRMSNLMASGKKKTADVLFNYSLRICIICSCAFAFGLASIAPEFVPVFFGEEFMGCISLLKWISPTIIMLALSATIRKQYLVPRYRNKVFITSMLIGTCVNIVSNAVFIPVYDALGAVYGTLIAEFTIVFIQYMMTKKELEYTPFFKDIILFSIIGGTMYVGVRFAANVFVLNIVSLLFEIAVGMFIYIILSVVYLTLKKDDMFLTLKQIIVQKIWGKKKIGKK